MSNTANNQSTLRISFQPLSMAPQLLSYKVSFFLKLFYCRSATFCTSIIHVLLCEYYVQSTLFFFLNLNVVFMCTCVYIIIMLKSPEILSDKDHDCLDDEKTDIYAAGMILWELWFKEV
jgi:hypothetical protein